MIPSAMVIERFSAWSPGVETTSDLIEWFAAPRPLVAGSHPEAKFLPAMLRRRCKPLTRIMLTTAYECCGNDKNLLSQVRTVFASRHGSINESIGLLEAIAAESRVSAATFSHTVHNAQAGLFSIAAGNREASASLAGQEDTFPCAMIEALCHLQRDPTRKILLVTGDVPLAEAFARLIDEPPTSYGVAMLLSSQGDGERISVELAPASDHPPPTPWPAAFEILRWLHSADEGLDLTTPKRMWRFRRLNPSE